MSIRVLFFGSLAERMGGRERLVEAPPSGVSLSELKRLIAGSEAAVLDCPVRAAVDQQVTTGDPHVRPGQEVAFFPVYSGG